MRHQASLWVIVATVVIVAAAVIFTCTGSAQADLNIQIFFDGGGCGGYAPYYPPPCRPVLVQPPMYGGFDPYFQPRPRYRPRPVRDPYYGQPPGYFNGGNPYGGFGGPYDLVQTDAYQRRMDQLRRDQQFQMEDMARRAGRRAAEQAFYGSGGQPFYYNNGGW